MRESEIYRMKENSDQRLALVYRQLQFLDTRMRAFELALNSRWDIIKFVISPKSLGTMVNGIQKMLLNQHNEQMRAVAQKQREESLKPKIAIVPALGLLLVMLLSPGCVSLTRYKADIKSSYGAGYAAADKECLTLQARLGMYVNSLQERLKLFNQMDDAGHLFMLKVNEDGEVKVEKDAKK